MNSSGRTRPKQRFPPSLRPDGRLCHLSKKDDPGGNHFRANVGKGVNAGDFERVCRGQPDVSLQVRMVKRAVGPILFSQQHIQPGHRNPAGCRFGGPGRGKESSYRGHSDRHQRKGRSRPARNCGKTLIARSRRHLIQTGPANKVCRWLTSRLQARGSR